MPQAAEYGVESVLDVITNVLQLEGRKRGVELDINCPHPNHSSRGKTAGVNLETGYWSCFSCGKGGDFLHFVETVTGLSKDEALDMLRPSTEEALRVQVSKKLQRIGERARPSKRVELPGPYEPGPLTYLRQRGLTQETLKRWGVRYVHEAKVQGSERKFVIRHNIAIPIRDQKGRLLAWCYRATPDSDEWQRTNAKYLYTYGVDINELWFGLQHHQDAREMVVVEGALDTMWLDQNGIPARGLLGANMGDHKILQLQKYDRVTLLADHDDAGVQWVGRLGHVLGARLPVYVARYARWMQAEDPMEMMPVDIELALARARPWMAVRSSFPAPVKHHRRVR